MAKGGAMSFEAAKAHLEQYGLADRVIVFDQSSATVAMAAQAAGTSEAEIAKTLSFLVDDAAVLIVAAGDAKVNSSKFKAKFHTKAKMVPADRVEELVGHAPGGVAPLPCVSVCPCIWTSLSVVSNTSTPHVEAPTAPCALRPRN